MRGEWVQVKRVPSLGSQALRPAWHGSGQVMQEAGTGMSDRDMLGAGILHIECSTFHSIIFQDLE